MSLTRFTPAVLFILAMGAQAPFAQDNSFEIPPADSKAPALGIGGNLDVNYSLLLNRTDSALLQLANGGRSESPVSASYPLDLYLNGDYQAGALGVHLKTQVEYEASNTFNVTLNEAYGSLKLSDGVLLRVGKTIYNWGKGYAFNPVGFVNPAKDPGNLDFYLGQGRFSANFEYSQSLQSSVLQNFSLDLLVIPPVTLSPSGTSDIQDTNVAARLYLLLWDTDIDFMGYLGRTSARSMGMDFSRNIVPSLELHGEIAYTFSQPKNIISAGSLTSTSVDGFSYLVGLRWLNGCNMTTILEYYHNDAGLTSGEFTDYVSFLQAAAASGSSTSISQALSISKSDFSGPDLMQDYAYLKISWPEPFNLVDFTPSAFAIYSVDDMSLLLAVSFSYAPITNFEVILTPTLLLGGQQTLYGSKPYQVQVTALARYYF
jgi:hypothetical protein